MGPVSRVVQNFGIYFFELRGRGGHSSTRTPPRISRSQDQLKKKEWDRRGERGGEGRFFTGVSTPNERERERQAVKTAWRVCHREPPAEKGDREKWKRWHERDGKTSSVSRGPHSYISRETKTERSLGRGRTFCRSVADVAETAKRTDNPFSSLSLPGRLFLPRISETARRTPLCVRSLYVRQCRGTAAKRGRAPRNDLRLSRGRFGPPTRCRWVSREASSSSLSTCCRRHEGSWSAYLRMQERIRKPRQMSTPRSCLRRRILWFFGSVPTFYSQISQKRISQ